MKLKNNTRKNQWKNYLNNLLDKFRDEYAKLREDGRKRIPYNLYFTEPCQIEVIEFLESPYQILIISHDKDRKDREFCMHIYPELNKATYPQYIQKDILSDNKWDREVTAIDGKKRNLKDLLEDFFVDAFKWFEKQAFVKYDKPNIFRNGNAITEDIGVWLIKGDLLELEPSDIVSEVCRESPYKYCLPSEDRKMLKPKGKDAEKGFVYYMSTGDYIYVETHEKYEDLEKYRVKSFKEAEKIIRKPTKSKIKGFGVYLYPPVWVDEVPKIPFNQRIWSEIAILFGQKAVETTYNGNVLIITKDGFIAVGIDDKYEALKELNTIMASALINEIPATSIKEFELGEVTIDVQTKAITSSLIRLSSLRNIFGSSIAQLLIHRESHRGIISSKTLLSIIKIAEKISKDDELRVLSLILLEAYTHLINMEYSAAFLLSWYIIEHDLMVKWDKMLNNRGITGERKRKLRSHLLYKTADRVIEILNLLSKIPDDDYSELMKLKDIRNDIIHNGKTPSKKDAEKCFDSAIDIIKRLIKEVN